MVIVCGVLGFVGFIEFCIGVGFVMVVIDEYGELIGESYICFEFFLML